MNQRQFWIIIMMLIVWMIFSLGSFVYFKRECDMAKENPLKYAAERYDFEHCSCSTESGERISFNKTDAWREKLPGFIPVPKINFSEDEGG